MHQERANSECMAEKPSADDADCGFERVVENAARTRLSGPSDLTPEQAWKQARSSYYRTLLNRGLQTYQSRDDRSNPLMLGAMASTDNHFGLAGRVAEAGYRGSIASLFLTDEVRCNAQTLIPAVWWRFGPVRTRERLFLMPCVAAEPTPPADQNHPAIFCRQRRRLQIHPNIGGEHTRHG